MRELRGLSLFPISSMGSQIWNRKYPLSISPTLPLSLSLDKCWQRASAGRARRRARRARRRAQQRPRRARQQARRPGGARGRSPPTGLGRWPWAAAHAVGDRHRRWGRICLIKFYFKFPSVFWTNSWIQLSCLFQFFPMNTINYCFETLISKSWKSIVSGNSFQVIASIDTSPKNSWIIYDLNYWLSLPLRTLDVISLMVIQFWLKILFSELPVLLVAWANCYIYTWKQDCNWVAKRL